ASITIDTPEPTNFDSEGSDDPDISIPGARKVTGEFAVRDMAASIFTLLMGGVTSNTSVYKASSTTSAITEKSIRLVSKTINGAKHTLDFPRVSLRAGGQLKFAKATPGSLTASFVMLNAGPNTPPYKKTKS
ncbi:MAG: hypothetical protein M0P69_21345, partial [Bacteroidales bacterium]|nr:hypothetical protein [Bacteroidales bacterium]